MGPNVDILFVWIYLFHLLRLKTDVFRYFRIVTGITSFFSLQFRKIFAITKLLLFSNPKSNFGTRIVSKFAKDKNPEIKSCRIALFI